VLHFFQGGEVLNTLNTLAVLNSICTQIGKAQKNLAAISDLAGLAKLTLYCGKFLGVYFKVTNAK